MSDPGRLSDGTAAYGQELTAVYTPVSGEAVSYQWNRGGSAISGATGSTYTLTADDVGKTITVTATPTDTTGYVAVGEGDSSRGGRAACHAGDGHGQYRIPQQWTRTEKSP